MTFDESFELMGRDESFRATVYAMNTLLIKKGFYTSKEFEQLFCEQRHKFSALFLGKKIGNRRLNRVNQKRRNPSKWVAPPSIF